MDVRLSVIVATLGRPSLDRTIASIGPQLGPDDEVLVASRFPERIVGRLPADPRWKLVHTDCEEAYGGANERNCVMPQAAGTYLCFIDDDDVYTPGALHAMRAAATDVPVIFRMDGTRLGIGTIWKDPELRYANVSTQTLLVPNVPAKLGHWEAYELGRGCDYTFITETCALMGAPVFNEYVVTVCRPHDARTVAVVTPWFGHEELVDDYLDALAAGPRPHQVLVVDNASDPPLEFANIRLDTNKGFCGGSNEGLAATVTDIVVFLNNDIRLVRPGWLQTLCASVEPGVLCGRIRNDRHAWVDGTPVPYIDGWCLAGMRTDLLDLGGFDESLEEPAYFSDNLLCLEARAQGMTLREAPVGLRHKCGQTARPGKNPAVLHATDANRETYVARARQLLTPGREAVAATA